MRTYKVTLFKRKDRDNKPAIRWTEHDPRTGKLRQRTETFKTLQDARLAASLKDLELNSNFHIATNKLGGIVIPWDKLRELYKADRNRRNLRENSLRDIDTTLDSFVLSVGKLNNKQFTQSIVNKYIDARLKSRQSIVKVKVGDQVVPQVVEKKLSPATINKELRNIRSFINWSRH